VFYSKSGKLDGRVNLQLPPIKERVLQYELTAEDARWYRSTEVREAAGQLSGRRLDAGLHGRSCFCRTVVMDTTRHAVPPRWPPRWCCDAWLQADMRSHFNSMLARVEATAEDVSAGAALQRQPARKQSGVGDLSARMRVAPTSFVRGCRRASDLAAHLFPRSK
jgi:hypothetical protein